MDKKRKKSLVMVGHLNAKYKHKGFREQEGHPTFGSIRTIRLYDNQIFFLHASKKVRITIEEI